MKTGLCAALSAIARAVGEAIEVSLKLIDPKYARICERSDALDKWNPLCPSDAQPCPDGNHDLVVGSEVTGTAYCRRCPAVIRPDGTSHD